MSEKEEEVEVKPVEAAEVKNESQEGESSSQEEEDVKGGCCGGCS